MKSIESEVRKMALAADYVFTIARELRDAGGVVRWVLTELDEGVRRFQAGSREPGRAVMETIVPPTCWEQYEPIGEGSWERSRLYPRSVLEDAYPQVILEFDAAARFLCAWNGEAGPQSMAVDLATTDEAVALWWHEHFRGADYPPAPLRTRAEMMAGSEHHAHAMLSWDRGEHPEQFAVLGMLIAEKILSTPERN